METDTFYPWQTGCRNPDHRRYYTPLLLPSIHYGRHPSMRLFDPMYGIYMPRHCSRLRPGVFPSGRVRAAPVNCPARGRHLDQAPLFSQPLHHRRGRRRSYPAVKGWRYCTHFHSRGFHRETANEGCSPREIWDRRQDVLL